MPQPQALKLAGLVQELAERWPDSVRCYEQTPFLLAGAHLPLAQPGPILGTRRDASDVIPSVPSVTCATGCFME